MIQKYSSIHLFKIVVIWIPCYFIRHSKAPKNSRRNKKHQSSPWDRPVMASSRIGWIACSGDVILVYLDPNPTTKKNPNRYVFGAFFVGSTVSIFLRKVDWNGSGDLPRSSEGSMLEAWFIGWEENVVRVKSNCTPSTCYLPDSHRQKEAVVIVLHLAQPQRARARGSTCNQHGGSWWWWFWFLSYTNWHTSQSLPSFSFGSAEMGQDFSTAKANNLCWRSSTRTNQLVLFRSH